MSGKHLTHPERRVPLALRWALVALMALAPMLQAVGAPRPLSANAVTLTGIGRARIGMKPAELSRAIGEKLNESDKGISDGCYYVQPRSHPKGLSFMILDGKVARVNVTEGSKVKTDRGIGIGDTEARVKAAYPGIKVNRHEYVDGHYLTYSPKRGRLKGYGVVFETDGKRVTNFRSGTSEAVALIEGCA